MPMIIAVKVNVEMFETFPIDFIGSVVISPGRDSSRITRGWNGHHSIAPIIQYAICNSVTESFQRCALKKKKKKRKREKNIRKKVHSFRSTFPEELEISRGDFSRVEIFILMMDFARSSSSKH